MKKLTYDQRRRKLSRLMANLVNAMNRYERALDGALHNEVSSKPAFDRTSPSTLQRSKKP